MKDEPMTDKQDMAAEITRLRARVKELEGARAELTNAMTDLLRKPTGVVPESAEPFYDSAYGIFRTQKSPQLIKATGNRR